MKFIRCEALTYSAQNKYKFHFDTYSNTAALTNTLCWMDKQLHITLTRVLQHFYFTSSAKDFPLKKPSKKYNCAKGGAKSPFQGHIESFPHLVTAKMQKGKFCKVPSFN